jgi:hypothetical protein
MLTRKTVRHPCGMSVREGALYVSEAHVAARSLRFHIGPKIKYGQGGLPQPHLQLTIAMSLSEIIANESAR